MTTHISTTAGQLTIAVHAAAACGLTLDDALTMPPDALRERIAQALRLVQFGYEKPKPLGGLEAMRALAKQLKQS